MVIADILYKKKNTCFKNLFYLFGYFRVPIFFLSLHFFGFHFCKVLHRLRGYLSGGSSPAPTLKSPVMRFGENRANAIGPHALNSRDGRERGCLHL